MYAGVPRGTGTRVATHVVLTRGAVKAGDAAALVHGCSTRELCVGFGVVIDDDGGGDADGGGGDGGCGDGGCGDGGCGAGCCDGGCGTSSSSCSSSSKFCFPWNST